MKHLLTSVAGLAAIAFAAQACVMPSSASAGCAEDAAMTKEMAMDAPDGEAKEMALEHVSMAMEKAEANMEDDCMAELMMAKESLKGEMMEEEMEDMGDKTSN